MRIVPAEHCPDGGDHLWQGIGKSGYCLRCNDYRILEIDTAEEYDQVLKVLHGLLDQDPQPNTLAVARCRLLAQLLGMYEEKNFKKLTEEKIDGIDSDV